MKKLKSKFILTLISLFSIGVLLGQEESKLVSPTIEYKDHKPINEKTDEKELFNDKMLNILFANKVGTVFGGSNDLSLQKFFASLDANDNSLSIGASFDFRDSELNKLTCLLSITAKFKANDNFAVIYNDSGDFQEDNVGLSFKYSYIGNGIIDFEGREDRVKKLQKALYAKYDDKVDTFNKKDLQDFKKDVGFTNKIVSSNDNLDEEITAALNNKKNTLYTELANEEIKLLEKYKLYRFLRDYWFSAEVFVPLGVNTYKVTSDTSVPLSDKDFYAFDAKLSLNFMQIHSKGHSYFLKIEGGIKNNNNIITENISANTFETKITGADNQVIVLNSQSGYITDFDQFLTPSLLIEPAFFFIWNNTIGFSPAIEFNDGEYDKTNWKLGIPISLKDNEGKPKVNFEIQWKEQNTLNSTVHLVGISASFLFGDLIN